MTARTTGWSPERWRRFPLVGLSAGRALARAEALLESAGERGPALAWSVAAPPALVVGRAPGAAAVDWAACREAGVAVHRRMSGGGPVLWDRGLLSLDVALPAGHRLAPTDVVAAYQPLGSAVAEALRALGLDAHSVSVAEARAARPEPGGAAALAAITCFGGLSPHEVTVVGRKVVGLAQVRRRAGALIQAGIALHLDAGALARLLDLGATSREALAAALDARAGGLDRWRQDLGAGVVIAAVETILWERLGVEPAAGGSLAFDEHVRLHGPAGAGRGGDPSSGRPLGAGCTDRPVVG